MPFPVGFLLANRLAYMNMSRYKNSFMSLRSLKTEIEHMQHLLEKLKVKLMKDFELWWAEQSANSRLQVCDCNLAGIISHVLFCHFFKLEKTQYCPLGGKGGLGPGLQSMMRESPQCLFQNIIKMRFHAGLATQRCKTRINS